DTSPARHEQKSHRKRKYKKPGEHRDAQSHESSQHQQLRQQEKADEEPILPPVADDPDRRDRASGDDDDNRRWTEGETTQNDLNQFARELPSDLRPSIVIEDEPQNVRNHQGI